MAHRRVSQLIADPTAPADTQRYQDTPTHAHTHTHTALTVADDGWRRSAAAVPGSGPSAVKKTGRPDGIKLARRRHTTIGSGLAFRFGKEGPRDPEKGGGGERTSQRPRERERERETRHRRLVVVGAGRTLATSELCHFLVISSFESGPSNFRRLSANWPSFFEPTMARNPLEGKSRAD